VAAATYIIGAVTRMLGLPADAPMPVFGSASSWYLVLAVMVAIMIPQVIINTVGIRLTARLNDVSVWWHIGGVTVIVALLVLWGAHHNDAGFLVRHVTTVTPLEASSAELGGGRTAPALVIADFKVPSPLFALIPGLAGLYAAAPLALVFVLGLLQAQWTYTGYDASAHVAEETIMARLNSAWGVFLSVAVSAVVGYALLQVLTWSIPKGDVAATANDAYPVLQIAYGNLPAALGHVVAVVIGVAMWLCGLASITSMARMWYAFARDDGMPGARLLKRVHPRLRTPVWSIVVTSALAVLITVYAAAFSVVTSISTITLYLAYVIPIWLNWRNRRRRHGEYTTRLTAPWSLGRLGPAINAVAIVWVAVISVVFALPPNELVLWTMLLLGALIALYWALSARRRFIGPARTAPTR